ncbi:unnamed protein product [Thelazia callipaeda]|uniref:Secreted protein n=1 Tax=Thelazia callipaeda TaxID=103827 RepID=A0A0N5DCI4_THECL|nr:unnamed protein product [Thelazia callipaeda]
MHFVAGFVSVPRLLDPFHTLWESTSESKTSCYGSLTASTSFVCAPSFHRQNPSSTPAFEHLYYIWQHF